MEITGLQDGKVMGNLYELDYRQHAAKLEQTALPIQEVSLKFEDGTEGRYPYEQYNHGMTCGKRCRRNADVPFPVGAASVPPAGGALA